MEVAGLVIGVAGLVGTFSACVECFDLVRVGKHLGTDYEIANAKLELVRLRFSRWGEAVGLSQDDESTAVATVKANLSNPEEEFPAIESTLGLIFDLFKRSLETSKKMKVKSSKEEVEAASDSAITNKTIQHLRESMQKLAIERQKKSALKQKASWALYRKRDLNELIEDLTDLVKELTELAPAKRQEELCIRELSVMDRNEDVAMLETVLSEPVGEKKEELDSALRKEVEKIIDERRGAMDIYTWKRSQLQEGARAHQGTTVASDYKGPVSDRPATYTIEDSTFGKNSVIEQGTHHGTRK